MNLRKVLGLGVVVGTSVAVVGYLAGFNLLDVVFINVLLMTGFVMLFLEHLAD